jgi:hypothetical protein
LSDKFSNGDAYGTDGESDRCTNCDADGQSDRCTNYDGKSIS